VVAAEVKGLSEQTAKATDEIAGQIAAVQGATDAAASALRGIGRQIADIHHLASSVAAAVEEQQAATADIARNVNLVATGSNAAAESSRFVTEVAQHTGVEAKRVASASNQLQNVSTAVSKAIEDFIDAVTTDLSERRVATRQKVDKVLVVSSSGRQHQLRTIDVSEMGMKIAPIPSAKKDEIVEVRLGTRGIKANVAWVSNEACGLRFREPVTRELLTEAGMLPDEPIHQAA
jgi:methyl-accepting chemotaxis protein